MFVRSARLQGELERTPGARPRKRNAFRGRRAAVAVLCMLTLALMLSIIKPVSAQESAGAAAYDALIDRALEAYRLGQFEKSRAYFEQAHAERPSARTWRGLGMASFELDRFNLARTELEAALRDGRRPLDPSQRNEVERTLAWMQANLGNLQLAYTPAEAVASVDAQTVSAGSVLLNPGPHRLQLRAPGYTLYEQAFTLKVQEPLHLHIELTRLQPVAAPVLVSQDRTQHQSPAPADAPALYERWWFWTITAAVVGGGVALAFVLTDSREEPAYASQSAGVDATITALRFR